MPNQDELNKKDDQPLPLSSLDSDYPTEEATGPLKMILVVTCGLGVVFAILTLLPMLFTYLSDGDFRAPWRAPAEIYPTDTAAKLSGQYSSNKPYTNNPPAPISNEDDRKVPINSQNATKRFSNNVQ
jgi:Na+-transporting methylmalonyl-CoA/oxaloacetate decarboxylase gamma subunit